MQASETWATVWDDSWEGSWLGHSFIHPWLIYSFINFSFRKHLLITYCDPVTEQGAGKEVWDTALTPQSSGKGKQSKQAIRVQDDGGEYLVLYRQRRRRTWTQAWVREGSPELVTEGEEALTSWRRTLWAGVAYLMAFGVFQGAQCFQWVLNSSVPKISIGIKSFSIERLSEGINFWNKWSTSIND